MSPDAAERVFERPADPRCLMRFIQLEALMYRTDDDIELLQDCIGPIERAVLENVDLAAAQYANLWDAFLNVRNFVPLAPEPIDVEPVRVVSRAGMIGDGDEPGSKRLCRPDHLLQRLFPVRPRGVAMHKALHVRDLYELWQRSARGQFDLPRVFSKLRRHPGQIENLVQLLFAGRLQRGAAVQPRKPVFRDAQAFGPRDAQ